MINLMIEPVLNGEKFHYFGKDAFITRASEDGKSFELMVVDCHGHRETRIIGLDSLPKHITPFQYRIINPHEFKPGNVIIAYKKHEMGANIIQAIIMNCSREMISFLFRDNGGEFRQQGLTARQIALNEIIVKGYPDPKIF